MMLENKCRISCICCMLFSTYLFAQIAGNNEIKFIKGNITDKIAAVRESSEDEATTLSLKAIDFSVENSSILGDDKELSTLAIAGALALPLTVISTDSKKNDEIYSKLYNLFQQFTDNTLRVTIIKKLVQFNKIAASNNSITLLKKYLESSVLAQTPGTDVVQTAIDALGEIGDGSTMPLLYECYIKKSWPQYSPNIATAIEKIADKSLPELIKIISDGDIVQMTVLFNLLEQSTRISDSFKSEIAENILSETLYIAEQSESDSSDVINLEFAAIRIILKNNWTRASALITKFFSQAKSNYKSSIITEKQFIEAINSITELASAEAAKLLSDYLGELNDMTEKNDMPSEEIVLTVINALGKLGNKSAFDHLLYVTYLNYPKNVIAAARDALTKLKW